MIKTRFDGLVSKPVQRRSRFGRQVIVARDSILLLAFLSILTLDKVDHRARLFVSEGIWGVLHVNVAGDGRRKVSRLLPVDMDSVGAPGSAWVRKNGMKEIGESLGVSGRGTGMVLLELEGGQGRVGLEE